MNIQEYIKRAFVGIRKDLLSKKFLSLSYYSVIIEKIVGKNEFYIKNLIFDIGVYT